MIVYIGKNKKELLEVEFHTGVRHYVARMAMEYDSEDKPNRINLSAMIITLDNVDMVIGLLNMMKAQAIALQNTPAAHDESENAG